MAECVPRMFKVLIPSNTHTHTHTHTHTRREPGERATAMERGRDDAVGEGRQRAAILGARGEREREF